MIGHEELKELEQQLKRVSSAMHEASHLAAALECRLAVNYAEVKLDEMSSGRTDLTGFYENDKPATVGDLLFTAYAGIEADSVFNLDPGHNTDEILVARLAALLPEAIAEQVKGYYRSQARKFIAEQKDTVFKLAEALMTRQRVTGDEAKAVSANGGVSRVFLDAVNLLKLVTWSLPN